MRTLSRLTIALFVIAVSVAAATRGAGAPLARLRVPTPTVVSRAITLGTTPSEAPRRLSPRPDSPTATPSPEIVVAPVPLGEVGARVAQLAQGVPAHLGLVVASQDGTVLAEQDADTQFEAASLYKLAIMVEVYRRREAGELNFSDQVTLHPGFFTEDDTVYGPDNIDDQVSVRDLLNAMITVSSNVAANALLYVVGTGQVNATMTELGLRSTEIRWTPQASAGPAPTDDRPFFSAKDAWNVTSPRDMARLFQLLLAGRVVSREASAEMLSLLAQQEIDDRLPAGLPRGTRVAHKTGNVDDVIHDAGVIYGPKGPIIVVAMSDGVANEDDVVRFMVLLGRLAYGAME